MSSMLYQCAKCHSVYIIDTVRGLVTCPECRRITSQRPITILPVEVI